MPRAWEGDDFAFWPFVIFEGTHLWRRHERLKLREAIYFSHCFLHHAVYVQ